MKSKYIKLLLSATVLNVLIQAGGGMHMAYADKIYLEAPPLLWEEQPEKKPVDDSEYWRRKYGLKHKQPATTATPAEEPQSQQNRENESVPNNIVAPEPKMDKATGITEGYGVGMMEGLTAPKVIEGHDADNSGSVVVHDGEGQNQDSPTCDFDELIGRNVSDIDFQIFSKRPVRVVYPNQQITMDMSPTRINLKVTSDGIIKKVSCF